MATAVADFPVPYGAARFGQWVLGVDKSRKLYLFRQGAQTPDGGTADYHGLTHWFSLPEITKGQHSTVLSNALGMLARIARITADQQQTIIQSVDAGAIMQGSAFVAVPHSQKPGQTLGDQGQKKSASEAVSAGVNIGLPSWLSFFGSINLWKGVGLILAGAGILLIAVLELRKL